MLSHRSRRRLLLVAGLGLVAAGVALAIVLLPSRDAASTTATPPSGGQATQASTTPHPRALRAGDVSTKDRHEIVNTLSLFISTSVARHHPERSWQLIDPSLRQGLTLEQWSHGNIPVVPYPAAGVDLITFESYTRDHAAIEVLLEPAKGSGLVRKTFQAELRRGLRPRRWTISSWVPEGVSESQSAKYAASEPASVVAEAANPQHLSAAWLFVPFGLILGGLVLVPLALIVRGRRGAVHARSSLRE
jgi:hypothetical protein